MSCRIIHYALLVVLFLTVGNVMAQESDENTIQEGMFFTKMRYYKNIYPILSETHKWSKWENHYDSMHRIQRVLKLIPDSIHNIHVIGTDNDGREYGTSIPFHATELHYLDYNHDGLEDLFFEQDLGYRGHRVKMYSNRGDRMILELNLQGMVVGMGTDSVTQANWFVLYQYPCCDGYIHSLEYYWPVNKGNIIGYQVMKTEKFIQSNLSRKNNLPERFEEPAELESREALVLYFRDKKPLYNRFIPKIDFRKISGFHPFMILPKNQSYELLNTLKLTQNGSTVEMGLIRFSSDNQAIPSIRHLMRKSNNTINNGIVGPQEITYYGWMIIK